MKHSDPRHGEALGFELDHGIGLLVARARFQSESSFS